MKQVIMSQLTKALICLLLVSANIIAATLAYRLVTSDATPVWMTPQEIEDAGDQPLADVSGVL